MPKIVNSFDGVLSYRYVVASKITADDGSGSTPASPAVDVHWAIIL